MHRTYSNKEWSVSPTREVVSKWFCRGFAGAWSGFKVVLSWFQSGFVVVFLTREVTKWFCRGSKMVLSWFCETCKWKKWFCRGSGWFCRGFAIYVSGLCVSWSGHGSGVSHAYTNGVNLDPYKTTCVLKCLLLWLKLRGAYCTCTSLQSWPTTTDIGMTSKAGRGECSKSQQACSRHRDNPSKQVSSQAWPANQPTTIVIVCSVPPVWQHKWSQTLHAFTLCLSLTLHMWNDWVGLGPIDEHIWCWTEQMWSIKREIQNTRSLSVNSIISTTCSTRCKTYTQRC